jgi:D-alanyl-D-alanine dipeptidase
MRRISTHEPVTQLRRVRIVECGEPLVPYIGVDERIIEGKPRWKYTRAHLLRQGVVDRLASAAAALERGYKLAIIEGWRPPHIQRRMYQAAWERWRTRHPDWSEQTLRRVVNRFTAPPSDIVPPPHSTGGALDVVLASADGEELDMSSPFEARDPACYPVNVRGLTKTAVANRKILQAALNAGGITNYPSEYWHWSYGDQGWAYRGGHEFAVYGRAAPDGYSAPVEDDTDARLEPT